jgi:DNA-binding NtrC family response regulator
LFYRLNRLVINIKPLRERKEDILFLSKYFIEYFLKSPDIDFTNEAKEALTSYPWPGNVRELRNVIERMCLYNSNKKVFDLADIDPKIASSYSGSQPLAVGDHFAPQVKNANTNSRYDKLKELFVTFNKLTRKEIVRLTGLSEPTATSYLKQLANENFIKKIEPNDSPRSHYFIIVK